jgi:predicted GNAT family N-acyltransferase
VSIEIRPEPIHRVREVRHVVLRPHQRLEDTVFDHDADADALHLGASIDGRLVAVATIAREPEPGDDDARAWRVRGMATLAEHRGRGLGGELVERCVDHARERHATSVWLNARIGAVAFYERHGFAADGGSFEVAGIGTHVRMRRRVDGASR